jgi:outer membrane biosynthesis protein TonB
MAREQLTYLLPPEAPAPRTPPAPKLRITPNTLNRVAPPMEPPPEPRPSPAPVAPTPKPPAELPDAPRPQVPVAPAPQQQTQTTPSQLEPVKPSPQQSPNRLNLQLPSASLHDQLQEAIQHNTSSGGGLQVPSGGPLPQGPGGPGGPGMQPGATILTPTEGVNFDSYIQRLLATLKRNWVAVMPQSALMGDKGMVSTTFQINRDGSVPPPDPMLERTSGKGPLDNAAMSAIHTSNPFEPLPSEFKGPYIRLRIVFLYNLPLDYAK